MISTNPKLERLVDEFWIPFCEEYGRLRQQRLNAFTGHLVDFLNDLLNYPLVRPWRESLHLFQEHYWQQIGLQLTSESYDTVAAFIERWVNDPRCHAHGPVQPDIPGQPPRRPPGGLVGNPKSEHPLDIPEGEQENMRRVAHRVAELEQKRIALTDEERCLYEAYIYENIRRQYTGERAIKHPDFWHARNDAFNRKLRGPSSRPAAVRKPAAAKTTETNPSETPHSHVVIVAPNVSGPQDQNSGAIAATDNAQVVEVAGPGPETTSAFRAKVQFVLEMLDPQVATWWKSTSISGLVRSRDASGLWTWPKENVLTTVENSRPILVVDKNFTVGQTAEAIILQARNSKGPFRDSFVNFTIARGDSATELSKEQQHAFHQAAGEAGAIAELFIKGIASLTTAGDLVVTVSDIADRGLQWDQLLSILPLLGQLPIGAIIIKLGNRELKLSKTLIQKLEKLTDKERKSILVAAAGAKTDDEAAAIIKREVALIVGDRQIHHAISETVYKALEKHKNLRGKYQLRDRRFESLAIDYEAHHGYEAWHRQLDKEIAEWIARNKDATEASFEAWLRWCYAQPDLKARFPKEF